MTGALDAPFFTAPGVTDVSDLGWRRASTSDAPMAGARDGRIGRDFPARVGDSLAGRGDAQGAPPAPCNAPGAGPMVLPSGVLTRRQVARYQEPGRRHHSLGR